MNFKLSNLWNWSGRVSRSAFVAWGLVLFAVKFNLDRYLFNIVIGAEWDIATYIQWNFPSPSVVPVETTPGKGAILLLSAIPFLWMGVVLTIQRLRSARLPLWLACLFVVPVLKWFLFLMASVMPGRDPKVWPPVIGSGDASTWSRMLPHTRIGSAMAAVSLIGLLSVGALCIGAQWLENYGWGLFVGLPFLTGFVAAILHGSQFQRTAAECVGVACLTVTFAGFCLIVVALEGIICLLMAAPLAYPLAIIGGMAGYAAQPSQWHHRSGDLHCVSLLTLPFLLGVEILIPQSTQLIEVKTSVEVNAEPQTVWRHVVSFSQLPVPDEWLFKAGIAYPIRAEIQGTGPGAIRHCVFSTGPFVEPITTWDEPRLLAFSVTTNPAPMQEWTPYEQVHPPHLHGFLVSERGQFRLVPLEGGRTRLEGTTWYRHGLWPATYWQWWSDYIIHKIHQRVLVHIQHLSEREAQ